MKIGPEVEESSHGHRMSRDGSEAGVPEDVAFRTKPGIALEQIEAALRAGVAHRRAAHRDAAPMSMPRPTHAGGGHLETPECAIQKDEQSVREMVIDAVAQRASRAGSGRGRDS
jgi:hypothetical protein